MIITDVQLSRCAVPSTQEEHEKYMPELRSYTRNPWSGPLAASVPPRTTPLSLHLYKTNYPMKKLCLILLRYLLLLFTDSFTVTIRNDQRTY